jgi:S-(hydroxymethyl)glutathione dehydrogenase/alcohol dehydrogenase
MQQSLAAVRAQGGAAVIVGNARFGESLTLDPQQFNQGKRLLGTWGGDSVPERDYARYRALIAAGKLDISPLISTRYRLDDINRALDDLEAGKVVRPLIDLAA